MTLHIFLIRILACFFFSVIIGFERQWRHGNMGLRTNVLVAIGSFLFVSMSIMTGDTSITRVAAQVVTGIGFLGAGLIMRNGSNVRGLNTAATLWCSSAIGTMVAMGYILQAFVGTVFILISNVLLRIILEKFKINGHETDEREISYVLTVVCENAYETDIRGLILDFSKNEHMSITKMTSINTMDNLNIEVNARLSANRLENVKVENLVMGLGSKSKVLSASWEVEKE